MTIATTGPLNFKDLQDEYAGSYPITMTEYYGRGINVPGSGAVNINQFRGATKNVSSNYTANNSPWFDRNGGLYYWNQTIKTSGWVNYAKLNFSHTTGGLYAEVYVSYVNIGNQKLFGYHAPPQSEGTQHYTNFYRIYVNKGDRIKWYIGDDTSSDSSRLYNISLNLIIGA